MSTRDLLAALPALTEVLTELSTRDLPELCLIGVRYSAVSRRSTGELQIAQPSPPPAGVLAWCDAIRAGSGQCLPSAGDDHDERVTVTATGQLGDLPVRVLTALPRDLATQLGARWTRDRLRELVGPHQRRLEPAGGAR